MIIIIKPEVKVKLYLCISLFFVGDGAWTTGNLWKRIDFIWWRYGPPNSREFLPCSTKGKMLYVNSPT